MLSKILGYQIPVLMYHRFIGKGDKWDYPWSVTTELFEKQMDYLNSHGYKTIFFSELEKIDVGNSKEKYIILTADDGYMDNYQLMYPILKNQNIKMNIFLISGKKYNSWDCEEHPQKYPKAYMLEDYQIKEMKNSGLVEFGLHGKNHKNLSKLEEQNLQEEITVAKKELEERLGFPIIAMTYPYGGYNEKVRAVVENSGIKYACATEWGSHRIQDDLLTIRRIDINNSDRIGSFSKKVSGYYNFLMIKKIEIRHFIKKIITFSD